VSNWPTIPESDGSVESLGPSVRSMKEAVEIMTGQRRGESFGVPLMYIQPKAPASSGNRGANYLKIGSLWINTTDNTLSYFDGKTWQAIKTT